MIVFVLLPFDLLRSPLLNDGDAYAYKILETECSINYFASIKFPSLFICVIKNVCVSSVQLLL